MPMSGSVSRAGPVVTRPPPPKPHTTADQDEGHFQYQLGDGMEICKPHPNGRYKILRSLGSGTYGKVVECWDRQASSYCAVKVIRALRKYRAAAITEVSVLEALRGDHGCVRMLRHFEHQVQGY
ncbi:hypothetical protein T484DRAFT_1803167 [Baffinella frigidus]|nr:hypothetical protein T484DRAFT_1803167 [Cryptophyta sp. CCMP2293]